MHRHIHMILFAILACSMALPASAPAQGKDDPPEGPLELKLVAKKNTYPWNGGGKSPKEYRKMLEDFADKQKTDIGAKLPVQPPEVELTLEITNKGKDDVTIFVGGDPNVYTLELKGPGVVTLKNNAPVTLEFRLPKEVKLAPNESYKVEIKKLMDGFRGQGRAIYWTEPGQYTLSATYQLAKSKDGGKGDVLQSQPVMLKVQQEESPKEKVEKALPDKAFAEPKQPRHLLIYTRTMGYRHKSIEVGAMAIAMLGKKTGAWSAEHTEDPGIFDENRLSKFDAILFLNTTEDCLAPKKIEELNATEKATLEQRKKNLIDFIKGGKGFAGFHSASDTLYSWKEYGEMLGGWFTNHPWHQNVPIKVDDPKSPLTSMFGPGDFEVVDEIYQFGPKSRAEKYQGFQPYSRTKVHVLLSLDASKLTDKEKKAGARPDEDYAVSWIHSYDKGRVFYCSLGHNEHIYWNPIVLRHYLAGLQYALGDLHANAAPSVKEEK